MITLGTVWDHFKQEIVHNDYCFLFIPYYDHNDRCDDDYNDIYDDDMVIIITAMIIMVIMMIIIMVAMIMMIVIIITMKIRQRLRISPYHKKATSLPDSGIRSVTIPLFRTSPSRTYISTKKAYTAYGVRRLTNLCIFTVLTVELKFTRIL